MSSYHFTGYESRECYARKDPCRQSRKNQKINHNRYWRRGHKQQINQSNEERVEEVEASVSDLEARRQGRDGGLVCTVRRVRRVI